jgi:uncharacterized membrane protein HdeD (DUF308 family)
MLAALAIDWVFLLFRGWLAVLFGCVVLLWPAPLPSTLTWLFAAYSAADAVLALLVAFDVRRLPGFGSLLADALVRMGVALAAVLSPALVALALGRVFAVAAVLYGAAAIAIAIVLRHELAREWPLPFAGVVSVLFGVLILFGPGAPDLAWIMGPYMVIFGVTLQAFALRLRQLAAEIAISS